MTRISQLALAVLLVTAPAVAQTVASVQFDVKTPGEAIATIPADCPRCDWSVTGREAVTLKVDLDGQYSQHLMLTHGPKPAYRIMLGPVEIGTHRIALSRDEALTARGAGSFAVGNVEVQVVTPEAPEYEKLSFAPILHQRPNTIGGFSDTPLLMWVESEVTPAGRRHRYSVIFTNEDGGTPTDRLMATWGRATDIELVYDVALDARGRILKEEIQAPKHEILPFTGPKTGSHPLLWVVTDNNMVSDKGESRVRQAPAPIFFSLTERSREAVMDANPWTYRVMAAELSREHKIDADARAGSGTIPDPRRYAYIEACGEVSETTAIAVDVGVEREGRVEWFSTDRETPEFRVARSGCFQAAAPLPDGVRLSSSPAPRLRVRAYRRATDRNTPLPEGPVKAIIRRVNTVFMLGDDYRPGPGLIKWTGVLTVTDAAPAEIPR
jgi:hypothetical protein